MFKNGKKDPLLEDTQLRDELVDNVEVDDEDIAGDEELGEGHNPTTAPQDSVNSVAAAGKTGPTQKLRRGDKSNAEPMVKAGVTPKVAVMAKEGVEGTFDEDLAALVESEATLSEGFKEKAEVIFEAALQSKLTEHVERLEQEYQQQLDEETTRIQSELVEKVDGYLNYVVESWMEENRIAINNGLRTEIAESFMQALHGVFTEHYITVPESKVDIVDELAAKVDDLEEQLNSAVERGIELTEKVKELSREAVLRESASDLSEAQAEKLASLAEGIEFESEKAFAKKVATIKESYFKKESVSAKQTDELDSLTEDTKNVDVSPVMSRYLAALKK